MSAEGSTLEHELFWMSGEDLSVRLPALGAWLVRMEAMRGYDVAYPPHWRS